MIKNIVKVGFVIGLLCLILTGYLAFFTDLMDSLGANGIVIISLIAGLGLLLLIPSKIYLMILFFQEKSEQDKREK